MNQNSKSGRVVSIILAVALGFLVGFLVATPVIRKDLATEDQLVKIQEDIKQLDQKVKETTSLAQMIKDLESNLKSEISAVEEKIEKNVEPSKIGPAPEQPWPYEPLDVEEVRKLVHKGYYDGGCAYGAFNAIISSLAEKVGYPYNQIPTYMLHFGRGGILGEESVCGSVLGSIAAVNLITGKEYAPIALALVEYYKNTPLPTDISNKYAVNHEFLVDEYLSDVEFPQSVAGSVNCNISKQQWLKVSGYAPNSNEQRERCGRITGDMAAKAAELLNEWWEAKSGAQEETGPIAKFKEIFPNSQFKQVEENVYQVIQNGKVIGYVGIGSKKGFGGPITAAVGINIDGTLKGVRVLEQNETPGLGDKITDNTFLSQFEGLSYDKIDVDTISSATISSKALIELVQEEAQKLKNYAK